MNLYEIKDTDIADNTVKDVDTTSRRVKVAISKMGNLDLDNDIIDHGAYNRTINNRGPKGANLVYHLTDHRADTDKMIAKFGELYVDGDYLVGVTNIPKTTKGNDYLELYETKNISQHSVGFRTIQSEPVNAGTAREYRLIKEIFLYEGSAVLWGANPETNTISVGKSITKREAEKDFFETLKQVNNLAKLFRHGSLTDEAFELVEIQLAQKTSKLEQLYLNSTQPVVETPDPAEGQKLLEVINSFTNNLTLKNHASRINVGAAASTNAASG